MLRRPERSSHSIWRRAEREATCPNTTRTQAHMNDDSSTDSDNPPAVKVGTALVGCFVVAVFVLIFVVVLSVVAGANT